MREHEVGWEGWMVIEERKDRRGGKRGREEKGGRIFQG